MSPRPTEPADRPAGSCTIVAAGVAEAGVLAVLRKASYGASRQEWDRDAFARLLTVPGRHGLIARIEERPVGYVLWDAHDDWLDIVDLCVVPGARRKGIGSALMTRVLRPLAGRPRSASLEVAEDNAAARGLYARLGFTCTGRRPDYYAGTYHAETGADRGDALVMTAVVKPAVGDRGSKGNR